LDTPENRSTWAAYIRLLRETGRDVTEADQAFAVADADAPDDAQASAQVL
jgi:hypothetical protein